MYNVKPPLCNWKHQAYLSVLDNISGLMTMLTFSGVARGARGGPPGRQSEEGGKNGGKIK